MVKIQKPIPKKLGRTNLENPIKKKKQLKEKSSASVKNINAKLPESPIREAKASGASGKEKIKKKKDKQKQKEILNEVTIPEVNTADPISPEKVKEPKAAKKPKAHEVDNKKTKDAPKKPEATKVKDKVTESTDAEKPVPIKAAGKKKSAAKVEATPKPLPPTKGPLAPPATPEVKNKKKNKKTNTVEPQPAKGTEPAEGTEPAKGTELSKTKKKLIKLKRKREKKLAARKAEAELKAQKKKAKENKPRTFRYDPVPFDEEKFNAIVTLENIKKIAEALKIQVQQEVASKKSSIFEDYRYYLQVGSFKIPKAPKRMVKLYLKHALVGKEDDVLLVVPDLQRGAKVDFEPTLHHYQDLLRNQGVEGITVMPMNQLRKEYTTFEQKRRLFATYDHFLSDGRIVSHVVGIVGKLTQKPRHTFHAVRMHNEKNLKREIEKSLHRTAFRQMAKGTLTSIPVGTHKFTSDQIADNIELVVQQLKKLFPGGLGNIRNLYLKIDITGTSSLPLFMSMAQAPDQTPDIVGPREQRMMKLKKEANEVLSKFNLTKDGKLIKLSKSDVEKKRKLIETQATLKADEVAAKKAKKESKKAAGKTKEVVEEIEQPENEEDDDEDNESNDDDEDDVNLASSDEDEGGISQEEDDEEGVDTGSETEIVENGIVENEENVESDEDGEEEVDSDSTEGGDDYDDDDDDEEEEEEEDDDDEDENSD